MMRYLTTVLCLIQLAGCAAAPRAEPQAALAVVPQQGRQFHGFASAKTGDVQTIHPRALQKCGDHRCVVAQEWTKSECAILVAGTGQIFWNTEQTGNREQMREILLAHCNRIDESCRILLTECY
jgi:hypothetical protein